MLNVKNISLYILSLRMMTEEELSLRNISITDPDDKKQKFEIIRGRDEKKYEMQKEIQRDQTKLCCSESSKSGLEFLAKFSISMTVLLFAMLRLTTSTSGDHSYEASLISLIIGYYIPSPLQKSIKKNNDD